jgi:hypothetical protein
METNACGNSIRDPKWLRRIENTNSSLALQLILYSENLLEVPDPFSELRPLFAPKALRHDWPIEFPLD